jgi:hypothetical protein
MEICKARRLAIGFDQDLEEVFAAKSDRRKIKRTKLTDKIENMLQWIMDDCESQLDRQDYVHEKRIDTVQENLLKAHGEIVDLKCELVLLELKLSQLESVNDKPNQD